jgi:hypothetical protein
VVSRREFSGDAEEALVANLLFGLFQDTGVPASVSRSSTRISPAITTR